MTRHITEYNYNPLFQSLLNLHDFEFRHFKLFTVTCTNRYQIEQLSGKGEPGGQKPGV